MSKHTNKKRKTSFGSFSGAPDNTKPVTFLSRADFSGVAPREAAERIIPFTETRKPLREVTRNQKIGVLGRALADFREKGLDLANVTPADLANYREWMRTSVQAEEMSENSAAHIVSVWNSTMRAAFGEDGKPGETLLMKGFRTTAKKIDRWSEEEWGQLLAAARAQPSRQPDDKAAFLCYLELAWATGGRIGSLANDKTSFADVDWETETIKLRHMKNRPEHTCVLTPRALAHLRERRSYLMSRPVWRGGETPILVGTRGRPIRPQTVNKKLREAAARAGISKYISTHVVRKSVGTHMGKYNPRFAQEQLGITMKIFEGHYNQPTIDDRAERRDILPGVGSAAPQTPEEMIGRAVLDLNAGRITQKQYNEVLARADRLRATPKTGGEDNSGYA